MKSVASITAALALVGGAIAQRDRQGGVHTGPAPASLSAFFSSQTAASVPAGTSSAAASDAVATSAATPAATSAASVSIAAASAVVSSTASISVAAASAVVSSGAASSKAATGTSAAAASTSSSSASSGGSGGNCIKFTADDPSWSYSNSAPWTGSGTFGSLPGGKLCLPSNSAGGAMYIGTSANPGAGNTKLECYFPTDSTQQSNCDISLVDGYSLSVTCTMKGASQPQIGGAVDLWTSGTCPGGNQGGVCKNTKAYDAAQSDVDPFFQPGIKSPNNYCIWWACTQDSFFNTGTEIDCHVSAGTPAAKKREVDEALEVVESKIIGRRHARSLE